MKLILLFFVAFMSISCQSFANDRETRTRPCPEGTYASYGRIGKGCCTKDNLYIYGSDYQYADMSPAGCGCPKGGKPSNNNNGCCSEDGYAFDIQSMKYDTYNPAWCCPFGGDHVSSGECCKDNYAYNERTKKYDLINGHCGCPDGGTPAGRGDCCKDGFSMKHNYLDPLVCGCPAGGIPAGGTCCTPDHLYRWDFEKKSYSDWCPTCCGCPDGGVYKTKPSLIGSDFDC